MSAIERVLNRLPLAPGFRRRGGVQGPAPQCFFAYRPRLVVYSRQTIGLFKEFGVKKGWACAAPPLGSASAPQLALQLPNW